jgi:hypothetical protein
VSFFKTVLCESCCFLNSVIQIRVCVERRSLVAASAHCLSLAKLCRSLWVEVIESDDCFRLKLFF